MIKQWKSQRLVKEVAKQQRLCESVDDIAKYQLKEFNKIWPHIQMHVPFYRERCPPSTVPSQFSSWSEFRQTVPVIRRQDLQKRLQGFVDPTVPVAFQRSTGGTTATPIQVPGAELERGVSSVALWRGRSWLGITPHDKLFLLWGHSHLFGTGVPGWCRKQLRRVADHVLGYYRYSAYDLSEVAMRRAATAMIRFQPQFVLGYSVALARFAAVNARLASDLRSLELKAIVATAESFPDASSKDALEVLFECPVVMEYGTVETGPIAHQGVNGLFQCFWENYFVETLPESEQATLGDVVVTSLFSRAMPLVRYHVGDQIVASKLDSPMVKFDGIKGRCNDYVDLVDGTKIHSETIAHIVKDIPGIDAYQVHQGLESLQLKIVSRCGVSSNALEIIRGRLLAVNPLLENLEVQRVSNLHRTIAGKTPSVIRSDTETKGAIYAPHRNVDSRKTQSSYR